MKRDFAALGNQKYDIAVIGAGISGACIAYIAALRGLKVVLLDKADFGHGTSSATSKLVHGGLRYLKQLDFSVVRESLHERRALMQIAPHLVNPIPFLIPTYRRGNTKTVMRIGLAMYDALSFDRNRIADIQKHIPSHKVLSKEQTLRLEPGISRVGLTGGILYYDCQMPDPNRLTLAFIKSAVDLGAKVCNYAELTNFQLQKITKSGLLRIESCQLKDTISGKFGSIIADVVINAAGPWADSIIAKASLPNDNVIVRSKGIHIVTRPITNGHAITLRTRGGRHFFIIPWRGHSLIGTTDVAYQGDVDHVVVSKQDVEDLLAEVNSCYPEAKLQIQDVFSSYCGLRPLVEKDTKVSSYKASRKYEVYDHQKDGIEGFFSVLGGKYTTSRKLAEDTIKKIAQKRQWSLKEAQSSQRPLHGGDTGILQTYIEEEVAHNHYGISDELLIRQIYNYGTKYKEIVGLGELSPGLLKRIRPDQDEIWSQVDYAIDHEMAMTLQDVVLRRTGLATIKALDKKEISKLSKIMTEKLGWDESKRKNEADSLARQNFIDETK